jgi:ABC-type phosphate transport system substrate-binding protein
MDGRNAKIRSATLCLLLLLSLIGVASAQTNFAIIVNPDIELTAISQADIARIYLGKKTFWDSGGRIAPALLDEKSALTVSFLEESVRTTVRQYRAYWKKRLFSGQGTAPKTFTSSRQVVDYVASTPGAVGVVERGAVNDRVKLIELLDNP